MSVLSEEEKNEASVLIESLSAEEKAELAHLTRGDCNIMTPLLIREYLWRKKNRIALKGIADDIRDAEYRAFQLPPPGQVESVSIRHDASLPRNSFFRGNYKQKKKERSFPWHRRKLHKPCNSGISEDARGRKKTGRRRRRKESRMQRQPSRHERIDLEEPHRMGGALRNSLEELSEMRIPAGKADPMVIRKILMPLGNMQSNNSIEHKCRFF